jgi:hypothetical protein
MTNINDVKKLVTYCGGFCGACAIYKGRIAAMVAQDLMEIIKFAEFADWVPKFEKIDFNFDDFLEGLKYLCDEKAGPYCRAPCKEGGGAPCKIKLCAKEKGIEICFDCEDFPCGHFSWLLEKYPEKLEECKRYKKLGLEEWINFHLERAKKGYASSTKKYYTQAKNEAHKG